MVIENTPIHTPATADRLRGRLRNRATVSRCELRALLRIPAGGELSDLTIELSMAAAAGPVDAVVELNDRPAGVVLVEGPTPEVLGMTVKAELLREGLNRLVLRYVETVRLTRRHREAAVRSDSRRGKRPRL